MKLLKEPLKTLPKKLDSIGDRVEYLRCALGFPLNAWTTKIGTNPNFFQKVVKEGATPTMNMLNNVLKVLPVSKEWLFLGQGQPFTADDVSPYVHTSVKDRRKEQINHEINDRFRVIRQDKGLSQVLFGNDLGVTKDVVASIENKRQNVSVHIIIELAKKFDVNELWMLYGTGNKYKKK